MGPAASHRLVATMITPSAPVSEPRDLVREVSTRIPLPLDVWEIAAFLESLGVTDNLAQQRYGCADVFVLAGYVLAVTRAQAGLRSEDLESSSRATAVPSRSESPVHVAGAP